MMEGIARSARPAAPGSHVVTFYDDDARMVATMSDHVLQGLQEGEGVVLILTQDHFSHLAGSLEGAGHSVERLQEDGRLLFRDAEATLRGLMAHGKVDERLFFELIDPVWRAASQEGTRPVRAVGEMVDILWSAGERHEAIDLERVWERYLNSRDVRLLCAYRVQLLEDAGEAIEAVVHLHGDGIVGTDRLRLDAAIHRAFDDIVGVDHATRLRRLVALDLEFPRHLGVGERLLFWTRRHLPERADAVMERARTYFVDPGLAT
ncbi:MAG: MEDS domain-containing protein [Euryarchaeota archaeon]|nr:MEDS domain-containing protein [Euryarchaeota archaeon]